MKKLFLVIGILFLLCSLADADYSFETGWTEYIDEGSIVFDPSGTSLNVSASSTSGSSSWGNYYKNFDGDYGVMAYFNVSSASSTTNEGSFVGLRKYVATTSSGTRILAEIWLQNWGGTNSIKYRIREREAATSTTIQRLAQGNFGETSGMWNTGEEIMLGVGFKNDTVYFYCSKFTDQVLQIDLNNIASEIDSDSEIFTLTEGNSSIQATVTNLELMTTTTYIAHITSNASWTDYLQVDNNSAFDSSYSVILYDEAGTEVYSGTHDISAYSEAILQPKVLSASARCGKITSMNDKLFFRYFYENDNGGVAEFKIDDQLYPVAGFYFNSTASMIEWKGLALANFDSSEDASITLYAFGNGGVLATATDTIPASGKLSGTHTKWFPTIALDDLKRIIVVSSSRFTGGIVICGDSTNSSLLFTGAADATGFNPPSE